MHMPITIYQSGFSFMIDFLVHFLQKHRSFYLYLVRKKKQNNEEPRTCEERCSKSKYFERFTKKRKKKPAENKLRQLCPWFLHFYFHGYCPTTLIKLRKNYYSDRTQSRKVYLYQTLSLFWSWPHLPTAILPMLIPALNNTRPKRWRCFCFALVGLLWALKNAKHLSGTKQCKWISAGMEKGGTANARGSYWAHLLPPHKMLLFLAICVY